MTMPPHQQMAETTPALRGPGALEPPAPQRRGRSEEDEEQRVNPPEVRNAPIARGREEGGAQRQVGARDRLRHAQRTRQRQPEHAEAVRHPDAEVNREGRRRHEPPVEAGAATMRSRSSTPAIAAGAAISMA